VKQHGRPGKAADDAGGQKLGAGAFDRHRGDALVALTIFYKVGS
jgi:hypothetical protein